MIVLAKTWNCAQRTKFFWVHIPPGLLKITFPGHNNHHKWMLHFHLSKYKYWCEKYAYRSKRPVNIFLKPILVTSGDMVNHAPTLKRYFGHVSGSLQRFTPIAWCHKKFVLYINKVYQIYPSQPPHSSLNTCSPVTAHLSVMMSVVCDVIIVPVAVAITAWTLHVHLKHSDH